jgi:hypothetical protein
MNGFYEHRKDSIRCGCRCFDRILLNGLTQRFHAAPALPKAGTSEAPYLSHHLGYVTGDEPRALAKHLRQAHRPLPKSMTPQRRSDFCAKA